MNAITSGAKSLLNSSVHLLNNSVVKEGVKNVAGIFTLAFGVAEIYDLYRISILRVRNVSTEATTVSHSWSNIAYKVVVVCAKISLILSAGVSRPGVFLISSLMGAIFSTAQLERAFGANTIFAINPWHPRHVVSIAAAVLALPSIIETGYNAISWISRKIRKLPAPTPELSPTYWMTDTKLRVMNLFNTVTSRPTLHLGNQFCRFLLRRV